LDLPGRPLDPTNFSARGLLTYPQKIREIEWAISDPEEIQKLNELREQNKST